MKLEKSTIEELKNILISEFGLYLPDTDLHKLAYSLVGYFDLLQKAKIRHKFENSSSQVIDRDKDIVLDKKEVK